MAPGTKRMRPRYTRANEDGMKLHLREVRAGRRLYRVVTLRPGVEAAFSTNYFHGTWHLVTDGPGARLLARLLWGLAYQRQPGTVVLIHREQLRPTPFDADPSDPILLVPEHLTAHDADALLALRRQISRPGPTATIRWHTYGLDQRLAEDAYRSDDEEWKLFERDRCRERCDRVGGFICYTAPEAVLKYRANRVHRLNERERSDYHFLAERGGQWGDGEVQIFRDYHQQLSDATIARREVLAALERPVDPETLRERVWTRKAERERRREVSRRDGGYAFSR